ncbi:hypothetical protein BKA70DRAFT_1242189 [Coprinopsis sp. MPI-PUGE-AT-0042]|nr:hypothetical protein BKA70DRAFT_1242189 [Coprinopsis sp. MPI-PUGE-AT-0042]
MTIEALIQLWLTDRQERRVSTSSAHSLHLIRLHDIPTPPGRERNRLSSQPPSRLVNWPQTSSKRWIVDRAALRQAKAEDLQYVDDPEHLDFLAITPAIRQGTIATVTAAFRRFYLKNSLRSADPVLYISACLYVAARAGGLLAHIKSVTAKLRTMFIPRKPLSVSRNPDRVTVLAQANVSLPLIATISQEIIVMYTLWYLNNEESVTDLCLASRGATASRVCSIPPRLANKVVYPSYPPPAQSPAPVEVTTKPGKTSITNAFLSQVLTGMREAYLSDLGSSEEGEVLGMSASVLPGSLQSMHHQNAGVVSGLRRDVGAATSVRSGYDLGEDDECLQVAA